MTSGIGGLRIRPRAAIVGNFGTEFVNKCSKLFPTLWHAASGDQLYDLVHPEELDLLILGPELGSLNHIREFTEMVNVISFSDDQNLWIPGPIPDVSVYAGVGTRSEEFRLPQVTLPLSRLREMELARLGHIKGWAQLDLQPHSQTGNLDKAKTILSGGALICDAHTEAPLAVIYTSEENQHKYAILPGQELDRFAWVETIVIEWAQSAQDIYPGFGDWTKHPDWLTLEEELLNSQIVTLEQEKLDKIAKIDQQVGELSIQLKSATLNANAGRRRLLTAQDQELVNEVAAVFSAMGFLVENVDASIDPKAPKREDLRLRDPKNEETWEAIVEVRGYSRSGFSTADLQRLARFADLYQIEKGRFPDKRIYVVNGQIDLMPPKRDVPFASAPDDLAVFSEDGGLVIWTLDLFRMAKRLTIENAQIMRLAVKATSGRWIES
jgi:hypothetical protein